MNGFSFGEGELMIVDADGKEQEIGTFENIEIGSVSDKVGYQRKRVACSGKFGTVKFDTEYLQWRMACERVLSKINNQSR